MRHNWFLIEKMVCQPVEEYDNLLETFENLKIKAWVNYTHPYSPVYEKAIEVMRNDGELIFNAMAGNLGLGCNAIHLLNLFLTMIGDHQDVHLGGRSLFPALLSNKRGKQLVEFTGSITATTGNQSFATISFHRNTLHCLLMPCLRTGGFLLMREIVRHCWRQKRMIDNGKNWSL